jgi:hypothetical protein
MPRIEEQPRVDKLTRPQQMLLVGKLRSQPDRTGGLDDLVIDEVKCALIELLAVLTVDEDGDRSLRKALLDGYEICLRQREDQGDRLDLRDIDQAVDVGGINDVADIDLPDTGYPIDRRRERFTRALSMIASSDLIMATSWSTIAFWESAVCVAIDFC